MRYAAFFVVTLTGWYLVQRLTAGNAYAAVKEPSFIEQISGIEMPEQELKPLRYFTPSEFGEWWPLMSTDLLTKLDEFRHRLGVPVRISPHPRAIGRYDGVTNASQHNVDMWGEVRAADVMFEGVTLERAYQVAKEVGFSGIGAYPHWQPTQGLHLDVRPSALGYVATWAGLTVNGVQSTDYAIQDAFV